MDALTGKELSGEGDALGGAVGFEAGVGPVPLVFHFEGVAGEGDGEVEGGGEGVLEAAEVVEAADGLEGVDVVWEGAVGEVATNMFDLNGFSLAGVEGVEEAKADAVF